jgi:hypothetical protein
MRDSINQMKRTKKTVGSLRKEMKPCNGETANVRLVDMFRLAACAAMGRNSVADEGRCTSTDGSLGVFRLTGRRC